MLKTGYTLQETNVIPERKIKSNVLRTTVL